MAVPLSQAAWPALLPGILHHSLSLRSVWFSELQRCLLSVPDLWLDRIPQPGGEPFITWAQKSSNSPGWESICSKEFPLGGGHKHLDGREYVSVTLLNYELSSFTVQCVLVWTINFIVLWAWRALQGRPWAWRPGLAPFIICVLAHANLIWAFPERILNLLLFKVGNEPGHFRLVSGCILNVLLTPITNSSIQRLISERERVINVNETYP